MQADLVCFNSACRARFAITDVLYNCPRCGGLLEATYDFSALDAAELRRIWRERRMSNELSVRERVCGVIASSFRFSNPPPNITS